MGCLSVGPFGFIFCYRRASNISRTESQNLIVSRLVLWSYLPNPLKSDVKSNDRMNM